MTRLPPRISNSSFDIRHSLLFLLQQFFQLGRHRRPRLARDADPVFVLPYDAVHLLPFLVAVWKILARVPAAAFGALEGSLRHGLADIEHVLEIHRQVPAWI